MERFMYEAIKEAKKAEKENEVPIGCVVVLHGKIIGRGHNTRQKDKKATSHAEIKAIEKACKKLGDWRLEEAELYVTLEPCVMCAGACFNSRIKKVVYGARDEKSGAFGGFIDLSNENIVNHKLEVVHGICEKECSEILTRFFENRRKK